MSVALTVSDHWSDSKRIHAIISVVFSGNYVNNGDTLDITKSAVQAMMAIKSNLAPVFAIANGLTKYLYRVDIANEKILVFDPATGNQIAAGAYPAGVTGDTVTIYAVYPQFR